MPAQPVHHRLLTHKPIPLVAWCVQKLPLIVFRFAERPGPSAFFLPLLWHRACVHGGLALPAGVLLRDRPWLTGEPAAPPVAALADADDGGTPAVEAVAAAAAT